MNLGGKFFTLEEEHVQMNGSWLPVTPEKPVQIRPDMIPAGWQENQILGGNPNKLNVPGSGHMKEMLQFNGLYQGVHPVGQTEKCNFFDGGSSRRANVVNPIEFDSNRLTSLELLFMQHVNYNGNAYRNMSESIGTAVRTPVPPNFHPHTTSNVRDFNANGFAVNETKNYVDSDSVYTNANHLLPNRSSECDSSNLYDFLNNDVQCSFSSLLNSSLPESEISNGNFMLFLSKKIAVIYISIIYYCGKRNPFCCWQQFSTILHGLKDFMSLTAENVENY